MTQEVIQTIDSIQVQLNAGGMNTINIILAFVMYGVALGIKPAIFVEVFKKPKSVLLGMLCQLVLLPAFTCLLAIALTGWISPMMGLGMILVAACPGGNISNFMSSLAKANVELSVSLTAISTALAVILTPFNFWCWGSVYLHSAGVGRNHSYPGDSPVGRLQDHLHPAGHSAGAGHPHQPLPAQGGTGAEKAPAVAFHRHFHCHGGAVVRQQPGRFPQSA